MISVLLGLTYRCVPLHKGYKKWSSLWREFLSNQMNIPRTMKSMSSAYSITNHPLFVCSTSRPLTTSHHNSSGHTESTVPLTVLTLLASTIRCSSMKSIHSVIQEVVGSLFSALTITFFDVWLNVPSMPWVLPWQNFCVHVSLNNRISEVSPPLRDPLCRCTGPLGVDVHDR